MPGNSGVLVGCRINRVHDTAMDSESSREEHLSLGGGLDYRLDTPFEIILVTPTSGNGLTNFWLHFDATLCLIE